MSVEPKLYWRVKRESYTSPGVFYWSWERALPQEAPDGNTRGYGTLSCMKYVYNEKWYGPKVKPGSG